MRSGSAARAHATKASLKRALLPSGAKVRRLPWGPARGVRMEIDFSCQTRMYLGLYETEVNRHLRALCRPGFAGFDVGGQFGYDALLMAKLTGGPVVSVECDPVAVEQMERNFAANPMLDPRLAAWNGAAASATDEGAGLITLDDLAERTFLPDVVKIDIEGAEADALAGAGRILAERRPGLLVEVHGAAVEEACLKILRSHGYRVEVVNQRRLLADWRPTAHNRWLAAFGGPPA
ncbi:MAG TPA: FkbM family methyltransferase [Actinomycetota bacterium]